MNLTAERRGDLAESLLPVAARLACVVHGDGGPEDVQQLLEGFDTQELTALVVVLAGLVDPAQRVADALSYLRWDENGHDASPTQATGTIRGLAPHDEVRWIGDPRVTGHRLFRKGFPPEQIAVHVGVSERTAFRWVAAWSKNTEAVA